ncbi:MAG TPA: 50S ribosomal protein L25 [Candidatus Limnocylindrales bacterium]
MARPKLSAEPRAVRGKQVSALRRSGRLPGVVYGAGVESTPISFDMHEFELFHRHSGRHAVVDLTITGDGTSKPVLLQTIQEHPISRLPIHVDLLVVNLQEEMTVDVPVVTVGESAAIDKMGGVLLHLHDRVMVRAKPDDLPSSLEIDITGLETFESVLHVSDLRIPSGVTLVTDSAEPLLRVQPPRIEEEPVAAEVEEGAEEAAPEGEQAGESSTAEAGEQEESSES